MDTTNPMTANSAAFKAIVTVAAVAVETRAIVYLPKTLPARFPEAREGIDLLGSHGRCVRSLNTTGAWNQSLDCAISRSHWKVDFPEEIFLLLLLCPHLIRAFWRKFGRP